MDEFEWSPEGLEILDRMREEEEKKKGYMTKYRNNNREKLLESYKNYHKENQEKCKVTNRKVKLKKNYGLTIEEYDSMLEAQGGCCAICGTNTPNQRWGRFCVDHDRETGKIRGLLCNDCNLGLGHFRDSPERLCGALSYLASYK